MSIAEFEARFVEWHYKRRGKNVRRIDIDPRPISESPLFFDGYGRRQELAVEATFRSSLLGPSILHQAEIVENRNLSYSADPTLYGIHPDPYHDSIPRLIGPEMRPLLEKVDEDALRSLRDSALNSDLRVPTSDFADRATMAPTVWTIAHVILAEPERDQELFVWTGIAPSVSEAELRSYLSAWGGKKFAGGIAGLYRVPVAEPAAFPYCALELSA